MLIKRMLVLSCLMFSVTFFDAFAGEEKRQEKVAEFVTTISDKILAVIQNDMTEVGKENELSKLFDQYVDTNWMGQFVLGRYNRSIEADTRVKYLALYHRYMKRSYIPKFRLYTGQTYEIIRVKPKGKNNFVVDVLFKDNAGGPSINLNYRIFENENGFVIRDIVGEGVSFVVTQRSDFAGLIKSRGIDVFVEKLEAKVIQMEENNSKQLAENDKS